MILNTELEITFKFKMMNVIKAFVEAVRWDIVCATKWTKNKKAHR